MVRCKYDAGAKEIRDKKLCKKSKVSRRFRHIAFWTLTAVMMMAACTSDDFVGDERLREANENGRPMSFNLTTAPQTRSQRTGADAASDLNKNFVVWGDKTVNSTTQKVFGNYQVNFEMNSAGTTTTNSAGWEYVGYKNLPYGTTTETGGTLNTNGVASNATASGTGQTIKYWDYSASNYNFFAYSLGKGHTTTDVSPTTTYAKASAMTSAGYTLSGTGDQLKACYISNKKTITPSASSGTEVELQFLHFASNVKMAFYETIPGYSVKEVKFYPDGGTSTTADVAPCLFASSSVLPTAGTYTVSFDETSGKAQVSNPADATKDSKLVFGTILTYTADRDYQENLGDNSIKYIGRSLNQATPTDAVTVLPNPSGTDIHLKVDYTLLSRDGNGEEIKVKGATATIPSTLAKWLPNSSYTYIFKISDNTNGAIGSIIGLRPISLDAVVNVDAEGKQETVTTITNPSITTYQKGSDYATTDEYNAGKAIYVVVTTNGGDVATLSADNAKLYTVNVTVADGSTALVTETVAANAIANPTGAKDANGNSMTISEVASGADVLSLTNEIAAADSPNGKAIVFRTPAANEDPVIYKAAKFTAAAGGIYVFEYTYTEGSETKKVYKVIKVATGS